MTSKARRTWRSVRSAVISTARQVSRTRLVVTAIAFVILVAVVVLVPLPSAVQLRDWATSLGAWFPLAFLAAHIVVTVFPFPRTAFTLAAGLLFGPALGVAIAVVASALSALIALLLVRAVGWQFSKLVSHPAMEAVDARLRARGWQAVFSLRMIPAVPFSVLNYAAGASAVRVMPYLWATLAGLIPGTAAVVFLGDALTGNVSPLLVLVSVCTAAVGVAGLAYEVRTHRRHHSVGHQEGRRGGEIPAEIPHSDV
ncbi:TVP38/TMEM64 family protein [Mycobacterium crocinum]|uniref:TVP38/TMEM64 family membrane protein n=1 Tax=Mycolicibacterium crocinum TaxID=388459 RepID=A0ABY3TS13_9MYCO|nr:TVP38/TMEM64 family protein [Mycolicibacterium crocinum]MCV7215299.1 TVP38/TMEM64 family protein [Mycolicibacterium crocinum]ULN44128.1 TVP38/TMEM64 family protein [Mycolicibacterium crocinum]